MAPAPRAASRSRAKSKTRSDPGGDEGSWCAAAALPSYLLEEGRKEEEVSSEVYDGLADGEVALHRPRQVEELRRDELEDLVHVDVVRRAREEEGRLHRSCVCPGLRATQKKTHANLLGIHTCSTESVQMQMQMQKKEFQSDAR
jgi:hypothetical protein